MSLFSSIDNTWGRRAAQVAIVGAVFSIGALAVGQQTQKVFVPPVYRIHRAGAPITVDGRLDEPAWVAAPRTGPFHFPWFKEGEREQSIVKLLWDDDNLYVAHICQDAHIRAEHADHDDPVPEDDCFEVMIVPDPARPNYYNVEWNVRGAYVDGRRPDGPQAPRAEWDVRGMRHAGVYVGTPNDDGDRDAYWICEVAIPWDNLAEVMPHSPPRPGDEMRVNFNRHGGAVNMQYSQWSPVDSPTPAFHAPHRFGRVVFSDKTSPFAPPSENGEPDLKVSRNEQSKP